MLKRTHRRTTAGGMVPRLFLLSLLLPGTLLFGCGEDTPQKEGERPGGVDTAAIAPGDTMAAALPAVTDSTGSPQATATATVSAAVPVGGGAPVAIAGGGSSTVPTATVSDRVPAPTAAAAAAPPPPPRPSGAAAAGDVKAYDPATFDGLLRANVANGKVDYAAFKASGEFAGFLQSLATTSPDGMSANEKLAFWVNAYNALVIRNVNDNPGIKQPLDVAGFFDKKKFTVAGRQVTLNQIENEIIRPTFKEPLIHFGLVCAARSCPPLINKAYTEGNVRSQLAANAEAYLADTKQNRYDAATKTLYLSKIFEWYKEDFGGNEAGMIEFAKKHGPDGMKSALASASGVTVKFNEYDWTLNRK